MPDQEPRYPLTARLDGGRVRHMARLSGSSDMAVTLCGQRGRIADDGADRGLCSRCAALPNPQDCRSYITRESDDV